jgi:hypothetical protein
VGRSHRARPAWLTNDAAQPMSFLSRAAHDLTSRAIPVAVADHARARTPLTHALPKNRFKSPGRGGRDLGNRYRILERSLRGKISLASPPTTSAIPRSRPALSKVPMFRGFVVPIQPPPPQSDGTSVRRWLFADVVFTISECCMSGCAICVYDLYEESLAAYNESVGVLRKKLIAMNVPEHQWPEHIQTNRAQPEKPANVVMSAFEEMERRLKEKHATQNTQGTHLDTSGS